ncbi:MAG: acetate/propionate family kinase [Planctomycetota bacterium]|jgi:acetate kinase
MDIVNQLQSHPLFETFTPEALAEVVRAATATTYQPGEVCVQQGEAGEVFGILISGQLEAVRGEEVRQRLGTIEPGECFGEMSLLTGNPTNADVVAVTESQAVVFLQAAVGPLIAMNAEAVRVLTRLMTQRLAPAAGREAPPQPSAVRLSLGAFEPMRVLSVSCRKHDMRYRYFDTTSEQALASGSVSGLGGDSATHAFWDPKGARNETMQPATHEGALKAMLAALAGDAGVIESAAELSVIGHRVCHGGLGFSGPTVVDDEVKAEIKRLADLAPMENPFNLQGIDICQQLTPDVPQVAVFDTAFHLRMSPAAYTYALPKELAHDPLLRRFGSHGISHEGAARDACSFLGANFDALKIIVCHLGTGASMSAIDRGRCVDSSMGLTPLAGLVMATRPGDLDPGLLLHLIRDRGISPDDLTERLYTDSGLLGLSGISGDVLTVQAAADEGNPKALLAIEVFCRRAHKYLASYIGLLGGADAIIFTGGVGENAPGLRARICQDLQIMDIQLDEIKNRTVAVRPGEVAHISPVSASTPVLVAGSNEEHTIARHAAAALAQRRVTKVIRVQHKPIPIAPSAHHLHLTQEHVEALFGPGHELTWHADLSQPGQFACKEQVTLVGPKGQIGRVRVLGPARPQTQVEIARTEEFKLGIDAPIRMSGDLDGSPGIMLEGPAGGVTLEQGVICAMRHIHMSPQDAMAFAVRDRDTVRIRVEGERSLIFGDVTVRVSPDYALDMHIDTDEANAAELSPGAVGYLDSIQQRATAT